MGAEVPRFRVWIPLNPLATCVAPPPHLQGLPPECPLSLFPPMGPRAVTRPPCGRTGPGDPTATRTDFEPVFPPSACSEEPAGHFRAFLASRAASWLLVYPWRQLCSPDFCHLSCAFLAAPFLPVLMFMCVKNKIPLLPFSVGFQEEAGMWPVFPVEVDVCFVARNNWVAQVGLCWGLPWQEGGAV